MKRLGTLLAGFAGLAIAAQAEFPISDNANIYVSATAAVQHNDNVFLNSTNEASSMIWDLTPGLVLEFGKGAVNSGKLSVEEDFQIYSDEDDLDTSLTKINYRSLYDDGKMKLELAGSYNQANQATRDVRSVNSLIDRDLVVLSGAAEVRWTEKAAIRFGLTYDDTDYDPVGFRDWRRVDLPVNFYYEVQPKLDLSAGFRYRDNTITGGIDSKEYFYNVGARGELAPKLTGEVKVGFLDFNPDSGSDKSALGVEADFTFEATPKTLLTFGAQNQYGYSSLGDPYRLSGISGGFIASIAPDLSVNGQLYYNSYSYAVTSQEDDFSGGSLGATWKYSEYVSFTGYFSHAKNDSNVAGGSFTSNIFSVAASLRY